MQVTEIKVLDIRLSNTEGKLLMEVFNNFEISVYDKFLMGETAQEAYEVLFKIHGTAKDSTRNKLLCPLLDLLKDSDAGKVYILSDYFEKE